MTEATTSDAAARISYRELRQAPADNTGDSRSPDANLQADMKVAVTQPR